MSVNSTFFRSGKKEFHLKETKTEMNSQSGRIPCLRNVNHSRIFFGKKYSKMIWMTFIVLFTWTKSVSDGANILAILPTASYSHQQFYQVYLKQLHKRGHNLTVVTPNPLKDPTMANYREIDLGYLYAEFREILDVSSTSGRKNRLFAEVLFIIYAKIIHFTCHKILSNPDLMNIYKNNEKYDLLVMEWGMVVCLNPFAKLADEKMIGISSFEQGAMSHLKLGSAWNPAFVPDTSLEYSDRMTFFQRVRNVIYYWNSYAFITLLRWHESNIAKQYFGPDVANPVELETKVSLVFDNSHVTTSYPRPNNINLITLGGPAFHLNGRRSKPLPKDIKDFLDDAPDGVIYFSLGTNVKTHNMTSKEEKILIESFSRIKQKILWKWENENLKVNLKNVKKDKWFPQIDILAHPNVKAFVTQAGLQSVGEAIEYHVPMITIPFFADQGHNARKLELEGIALNFDFDFLNVENFTWALNEIVYNKKYKENIVRFSALVKDQPIPPLEKAIWWTEYVIRHDGAPHLRSAAVTMPWYQYLMLDVLAVVFLAALFIACAIYLIVKTALRLLFKSNKSKKD